MYFVSFHPLKEQLRDRTLTDREALPYYAVSTALFTLGMSVPAEHPFDLWDGLLAAVLIAVTVAGILYCFSRNRGPRGHDFIQKSIVLGWVVFVRLVPAALVIGIGLYLMKEALEHPFEATSWLDVIGWAVFEIIYYERLGRHLRDTAGPPAESEDVPA